MCLCVAGIDTSDAKWTRDKDTLRKGKQVRIVFDAHTLRETLTPVSETASSELTPVSETANSLLGQQTHC
jgi:hypothetical protein